MSLLDEISRLNEGFSPEELMRGPEQEGLARQNVRLREIQTPDSKEIGGFDDNFLNRIMQIESGGNPRARTGSYKGLFQLSDEEFNRYGGGDIYDPNDNRNAAIRKLGAEREMFRKRYGEDPSPTDLYMMHQQGEAGYAAHRANPDAPAWQNMLSTGEGKQKGAGWARQAIWGNIPDDLKRQYGSVDNVTSADFVNMWRGKVEGGGNAAATFDPTGRTRMANGDSQGILGALGMQNQQPQGLLGALGDPETMAYIGMMLKGLSPYSNIDPNAMLSSAHTNALRKEQLRQQMAEQARDNARADERLGFDRERFNLTKSEHEAQQAERKAQQERDRQALDRLAGGGSSAATLDPTAVTDPATAEATTRRVQLEKRLESLNREWPQVSEKLRPQLRMEIERTEKALGMSASESRTYSEAKEAKSGAETAKLQVDRAVDILQDPNLYEGLKKRGSEFVGGIIGESSLPDTARKTNELSRIMTTEGLQELAKHLKPLSEREGALITSLMNNPGMALSEKKRRMEELQQELNKRVQRSSDTISDLEERERAGTAARRRGDSGNATRDALKNKYGLE